MMRMIVIVSATLLGLVGPSWADWRSEFDAGNAAFSKGDLDTAITDYTKAIELKPDFADAYYNRSVVYRGKGLYERAVVDTTKAIELKPDYADAYLNRGGLYFFTGFTEQAIADYTKAIELKPSLAEAYINRGSVYGRKGLYDQAIADWTKAIELKPEFAEAYYQRGTGYGVKGLHDQAIADYTKAIELKPDYADAYFLRSILYDLKSLHDQAIADSTKVIVLKPNFAEAYFARGNAYRGKKLNNEAIADYTKAIELKPDYADAFANRGNMYGVKGLYDQAIADSTKVIQLKPNDAIAYNNRAGNYHLAGQDSKGLLDANRAVVLAPKHPGVIETRAEIYEKLGQREKAIADYRQAFSLDPGMKDAQDGLKRLGADSAGGEADIAKAKQLNPSGGIAGFSGTATTQTRGKTTPVAPPESVLQDKVIGTGKAMGLSEAYVDRTEGLFLWRLWSSGGLQGCSGFLIWYMKVTDGVIALVDGVLPVYCQGNPAQAASAQAQRDNFKRRWLAAVGPVTITEGTARTHQLALIPAVVRIVSQQSGNRARRDTLQPAPAGFAWRSLAEINASVLVPDGWFFRRDVNNGVIAYFVSRENIDAKGFFETGLSLTVRLAAPVPNAASVDAEGLAKGVIANITGAGTVRVLKPAWEVPNSGFVQFGCVVRTEKPGPFATESGPLVTEYRLIVNRTTKTTYLLAFESPERTWEEAGPKGAKMLDLLLFDDSV
jgi:tetratricopeptide (TPR) repeat protein